MAGVNLRFLRSAAALALAACAVPPPPLAEPPLVLRAHQEPAPWLVPLLGPGNAPRTAAVHATALAHRDPPPGAPVQVQAAQVFATSGPPFPGSPPALRAVGSAHGPEVAAWLADPAAGARQTLGAATAPVATGALTWCHTGPRLPAVGITATADGLEVWVGDPAGTAAALPDSPPAGGPWLVSVAPDTPGTPWYSLVLQVLAEAPTQSASSWEPPPTPPVLPAVGAPPDLAPPTLAPAWQLARTAIGAGNRRPALLALAQRLGLPDLADLILAADDPTLQALAAGLPDLPADATGADLAWLCAKSCWRAVLPVLWRGDAAPSLLACLYRLLGAAASDPGAFEELLDDSADVRDLRQRLIGWHRAQLADRRSQTRLRAADWLAAAGAAVPGFDPLADEPARRAALPAAGGGR